MAQWRDAAKSTTLQDVYSEESGPYFECAQKLEGLLREWDKHFDEWPSLLKPIADSIKVELLGMKEPK